jgi:16S rRNA (cytosine967-C5)-methyltransferase
MSLYQMSHLDRIPARAVIHDAVEIAKAAVGPSTGRLVNAVLRRLDREKPWRQPRVFEGCPLWVRASLPRWLWRRWASRYGTDRALEYALSLNRPPRAAFRAIPGVTPHGDTSSQPSEVVPGCYLADPGIGIEPHEDVQVMDEASQLVPFLLGAVEGAWAWEPCGAPGGKSLILVERCGPSGRVITSDASEKRLRTMRERHSSRRPFEVVVADAGAPFPFRIQFDVVLLDAPCSGLGTLRRNPEIKWRIQPARLAQFGAMQRRMLESVAGAVKIGGKLLYSTCSTEPEENEQPVAAFLARNPGFRLLKPFGLPGLERWLDASGMFRSFPEGRLWDGFFAALMVRIS